MERERERQTDRQTEREREKGGRGSLLKENTYEILQYA